MGTNQFWNAHSSTMLLQIDGLKFSSYFHHYPITSWIPMKITSSSSSSSSAVVPFDLNGRGERVWSQRRWIFGSLGVQDSFFDAGSCGHRNANFRILKWRYCTICLAIFCGDIPLQRPLKKAFMVGTSNLGSWNGHWTSQCEKLRFWWGCIKIYATYFWRMSTRELTHTHIVADVLSFMLWFVVHSTGSWFHEVTQFVLVISPTVFFNPDSTFLGIPV